MKWGAFNPCEKCNATPRTEDDLAISLLMSDHYFDKPTMEHMGADVAAGKPPQIDPETRRMLITTMRVTGMHNRFLRPGGRATDLDYQPSPPPPDKPWWKKLF